MTHAVELIAFALALFVAVYGLCLACYMAGLRNGHRQDETSRP